jgi:hypothetical protein
MLAVAIRNYNDVKTSQTLFGMSMKGMVLFIPRTFNFLNLGSLVSVYRAEFSREYLESVTLHGTPKGHVVMYKYPIFLCICGTNSP